MHLSFTILDRTVGINLEMKCSDMNVIIINHTRVILTVVPYLEVNYKVWFQLPVLNKLQLIFYGHVIF